MQHPAYDEELIMEEALAAIRQAITKEEVGEMTLVPAEPRRLHRRRTARLCRLCAFHPPLGHQPVAV
jgi:hypothetical protein